LRSSRPQEFPKRQRSAGSCLGESANNPEVVAKLRNMRIIPNYKPPEELRKMISEDYENARQVVKQMKLSK